MGSVSPFVDDPIWNRLLSESAQSTKVFSTTFLPSLFNRPFASITDEIFDVIDNPLFQKVAIAAPRGWGKTTIVNNGYPARHICFGLKKFIACVSNTADKAIMDSANLKSSLTTQDPTSGDILPLVFGDLRSSNWAAKQFVAGDTYVLPRGAGQQIRGLNYMGNRPDLIVVDDLEDAEAVMSEERRAKLKEWFFADLMNSVDRSKNNWKVVIIGTILHEDSLLANLMKDETWKRVRLSLCDDNLKSNWPEFLSDAKVEELFQEFMARGQADVFAREYQNKPISNIDAVFRPEYFRYYEPADILEDNQVYFVTIVDPAKTVKLHSDDSAVVTVGVDLTKHSIFFHDCKSGRFHPDELYDAIFEQVVVHNSRVLAVEVTSLHEFITQPIKNEMSRRGIFPQFVELNARDKKENRVAQLAPFYRQGYVFHNKAVSSKLELQLTSFPRSELWDVMDAFAYIIELMELDDRYFFGSEEDVSEDEYAILEDEPGRQEDWRMI